MSGGLDISLTGDDVIARLLEAKTEQVAKAVAAGVFAAANNIMTDAKKQMQMAGWRPPEGAYRKFKVMGKEFDPAKPEEYANSFAISKMAG